MIDKLHLKSDQHIGHEQLERRLLSLNCSVSRVLDKQYSKVLVAKKSNKHILTVKTAPRMHSMPKSMIYLNPAHFETFTELNNTLIKICDLDSLQITRIDHKADLDLPIESLVPRLIVKGKRHRSEYGDGGKLTGFDFGKNEEVIIVYDKAFERIRAKKYKLLRGQLKGICTRIEVRHCKTKVKYKRYLDLNLFLNEDPFKSIQLYDLKSNMDTTRFGQLQEALSLGHSLHAIYRQNNENRNFFRTHGKYLHSSKLQEEVRNQYKQDLARFLEN